MTYGLFASSFSPFPHPGHIWAMYQALDAGKCDSIVALLHADPTAERPNKMYPALSVVERQLLLLSLSPIARVVPYQTERDLYRIYQIANDWFSCVTILGDEYKCTRFTGHDLGMQVFFARRKPEWSGTLFSERISTAYLRSVATFKGESVCLAAL